MIHGWFYGIILGKNKEDLNHMSQINTLDLKASVSNALADVFDSMLSMDLSFPDATEDVASDGTQLIGSVSFAGKAMGSINLCLSGDFARHITAAMLDMDDEDIEGDEEVYDVVGELSNMIGGDLKSRLCDAGLTCELSIPTITSGKEFRIHPKGWTRHERLVFSHDTDTGLVDVYIKSEN